MSSRVLVLLLIFFLNLHGCLVLASDPDPLQDFCISNPAFGSIKIAHLSILPCKNSSEVTTDDFVFSGLKSAGNFTDTGLATIPVNPTVFPGLNTLGMSFVRADLKVGGINSPHFHPRATEIAYVVQGQVYAGFVDSGNRVFARVIEQGEVMVFPRGLVHFQMNVGKKPATILEVLTARIQEIRRSHLLFSALASMKSFTEGFRPESEADWDNEEKIQSQNMRFWLCVVE